MGAAAHRPALVWRRDWAVSVRTSTARSKRSKQTVENCSHNDATPASPAVEPAPAGQSDSATVVMKFPHTLHSHRLLYRACALGVPAPKKAQLCSVDLPASSDFQNSRTYSTAW